MSLEKEHKKTLEEDDEFEDFPVDTWPDSETVKEASNVQSNLWKEDWDDVEVDDDFTKELRSELEKHKQ
ncbi:LANO_0H22452g1_1 [Lachancea nothofagi CBS 11611]|uniref:26S proteasome complex subunit SEM1 n=1 Tax=Lachancea nothofagi CBS 11611 TaxID=1266666 RepID=A0A1G4KNM1_9SACH|nr:LANO_0H22452g1_1 [Lachancea nothofagi CBS 11611]